MNLSNINNIKKVMEENGLTFKKKYGQNFLIDQNVLRNISGSCKITDKTGVIEIGPGLGSLTEFLKQDAKKVLCYEIDTDLVNILVKTFEGTNVKIKHQDILKADILKDIEEEFSDCEEVVVCSNLPYYITSPILTYLLENNNAKIKRYVLMMQKEVATKLVNNLEINALSHLIGLYMNIKKLLNIPKNVFHPKPNVDSSVILLERKDNNVEVENKPFFYEFLQNIFKQRRKTLLNNIFESYSIDKEECVKILEELKIDASVRSEQLSTNQIIELSDKIYKLL